MYNHNKIEKKWQKFWEENKTYKFEQNSNNEKYYALDMFPYPSGKGLHVGHPKGYTATDIISRFKKLNGFDVLHPIGWDAFGLPAEQYAIDTNNDPAEFTNQNIDNFRNQLKKLGFCFDYEKEVNTTDPKYFKWTQWIFLQLFKHGLAEIKDVEVNWCEKLGTVLSNEEVLIDKNGNQVSERGNHPVVKKLMRQWVLKITKYADKLLSGLNEVDWPEGLKNLQRNWIGKKTGYEIKFNFNDIDILVFINDIDNLANVQNILINPKSNLLSHFVLYENTINYINEFKNKSDRFLKTNKSFVGIKLKQNFLNPITNKPINLYLADFIYSEYNDFDFVCLEPNIDNFSFNEFIKFNDIKIELNSNQNLNVKELLKNKNISFTEKTTYKLKDWLFSRQRYWGEPFPIIFDSNNNPIAINENELPLLLPKINNFKPDQSFETPLQKATDWLNITINNKKYTRDINTMPQWAGSCWYYLAYILKQPDGNYIDLNSSNAFELFKKWLPVDLYIGGQEHAVLHLLYARFWHRFLYDINIVPTKEPFYKIINQGMILGPDGEKMSKSKGNIINPDEIIDTHGSDALRLYEMFMGPLTASMSWNDDKLNGIRKWLDRVYRLYFEYENLSINKVNNIKDLNADFFKEYNLFIKNVTNNLNLFQFNLAISDMMVFINSVYKYKQFNNEIMKSFAIILSVFAPHISEEIYTLFKQKETISIFNEQWPKYDESLLESKIINLPIMIKNKPRDILQIDKSLSEDKIKELVLSSEKIKKFLENKEILKIIIIKDKVVNILLKE